MTRLIRCKKHRQLQTSDNDDDEDKLILLVFPSLDDNPYKDTHESGSGGEENDKAKKLQESTDSSSDDDDDVVGSVILKTKNPVLYNLAYLIHCRFVIWVYCG